MEIFQIFFLSFHEILSNVSKTSTKSYVNTYIRQLLKISSMFSGNLSKNFSLSSKCFAKFLRMCLILFQIFPEFFQYFFKFPAIFSQFTYGFFKYHAENYSKFFCYFLKVRSSFPFLFSFFIFPWMLQKIPIKILKKFPQKFLLCFFEISQFFKNGKSVTNGGNIHVKI